MIKLGVIGLSSGNGHPYSWSAIINGDYNPGVMNDCGYAGIPLYLQANRDTLGIHEAKVTHVWTQDRDVSEKVARASQIETVVNTAEEMIGSVDGVLLARDDFENHVEMARPFLAAGVPLFIDKPLAATWQDLAFFEKQHQAGRFFMSCSSLRYAAETRAVKQELHTLGKIELVTAVGKKDWFKYGVHMLEGLYALFDDPRAIRLRHVSTSEKDIVFIEFETGLLVTVHLFYHITPTFQISVFGSDGWRFIEFKNWYSMFRDNLIEFIRSIREGKSRLEFSKTRNIIASLIAADDSRAANGKEITLETDWNLS